MPTCERQSPARDQLVRIVTDHLIGRGELFTPAGAAEIAERMVADYDASRMCPQCGQRIEDQVVIREKRN